MKVRFFAAAWCFNACYFNAFVSTWNKDLYMHLHSLYKIHTKTKISNAKVLVKCISAVVGAKNTDTLIITFEFISLCL